MKKFILLIVTIILFVGATGCFKRDNMENINIITTVYPIEYITNKLYGSHSVVNSIYPDDTNTKTYKLNKKQINDFSKKDLFIYMGSYKDNDDTSTKDKEIAANLVNKNNGILIIDGSYGMEYLYGKEELWLDPTNMLMIAQNIKSGLGEYIKNTYLKKEINNKYNNLKVELSELDANIKLTAENATNKTIVVASDSLQFLEKYGFNVIVLKNNSIEKTISDVTNKINKNEIKYIYMLEHEEENKALKTIMNNSKVKIIKLETLDTITDDERDNKVDYINIMNKNIDLIKKGTYN